LRRHSSQYSNPPPAWFFSRFGGMAGLGLGLQRPNSRFRSSEVIQRNSVFSNTSNLCSNFQKENWKFAFSLVHSLKNRTDSSEKTGTSDLVGLLGAQDRPR
jgi:hypothetical protein